MSDLLTIFEKFPDIIREAAQSPLGIVALIILVVSGIAILFFRTASEKTRLAIFICIIIGFLGCALAIYIYFPSGDNKHSSKNGQASSVVPICPSLKIHFKKQFPYYLINTFIKNRDNPYIYWAVLAGENDCKEPKPVEVRFEVRNKTVAQATDIPWKRTFNIGEKVSRLPIDPQFEFLRRVENTELDVTWEIRDQNTRKIINSGTVQIKVISENFVDWNLRDFEDKVPVDFLLASLTAWALDPGELIRTQAQNYVSGSGTSANAAETGKQWFRLCYEDLFSGAKAIKVQPLSTPWPPFDNKADSLQRLKTPAEILQSKEANSLEAALLMAALRNGASRKTGARLCLFVIPKMVNFVTVNQFIMAWSVNSTAWHGLDLTDPNKINFNDNESTVSVRLNEFLNIKKNVLAALDDQGVFVDDKRQTLALDFDKAPKNKKFSIGALPSKKP